MASVPRALPRDSCPKLLLEPRHHPGQLYLLMVLAWDLWASQSHNLSALLFFLNCENKNASRQHPLTKYFLWCSSWAKALVIKTAPSPSPVRMCWESQFQQLVFIEHLLFPRHRAKHIIFFLSPNSHENPVKEAFLSPLCQWWNWDSEKFSKSLRVTQGQNSDLNLGLSWILDHFPVWQSHLCLGPSDSPLSPPYTADYNSMSLSSPKPRQAWYGTLWGGERTEP